MLTREENEFLTETNAGMPMGELLRRFWLPVLLSSELPAPDCPPVRVRILGEDLVAFKDSEGKVGMLDAHCPHRRADLFFGRNEEAGLRCVYHGWKFDVSGACVDMPNEPAESNFKGKISTTAYPCQEHGTMIWAYLGPRKPAPEFPPLPWTRVPDSHVWVGKMLLECNYLQGMEGEIDNSHVAFLHSILDPDGAALATLNLTSGQSPNLIRNQMMDKRPRGFMEETDYGVQLAWRRNGGEGHFHWRVNQWLMPNATMISGQPGATQIAVSRTPRDDASSWAFMLHWNAGRPLTIQELSTYNAHLGILPEVDRRTFRTVRNPENNFLIDRTLQRSYSFAGIGGSITNHDAAVMTGMGPVVDRTQEHLGTADVGVIAVRRRLENLARALQAGEEPYAVEHPDVFRVVALEGLLPQARPYSEVFNQGGALQQA